MALEKEMQSESRRKRVRVIKYILVISVITFMLVPTVLCLILFSKVNKLNKQLDSYLAMATREEVIPDGEQALADDYESQMYVVNGQVDVNNSGQDVTLLPKVSAQEDSNVPDLNSGMENESVKKIYLTFDDGPSSNTNEILDILAEYNVKATFFVVGKEGEKYEALYQRIVDEGHTLGMHTYSHRYSTVYASVDAFAEDLTKLRDYLFQITGVESKYFRFPGGSSNTVCKSDMKKLIQYVKDQGLTYFDWNASSQDATGIRLSASDIVSNCLKDLDKHNTIVILMHDAAGKETTVEALPMLIEKLQGMEQVEILPITEETELVQHITIREDKTED